jgi:hypothetical protein
MKNLYLEPYLHEVLAEQKEHVKRLDESGCSFNTIIKDLRACFNISEFEAHITLMLVFPNYH